MIEWVVVGVIYRLCELRLNGGMFDLSYGGVGFM